MTTEYRTAPYLRVLVLSFSLLVLMTGVVGLGSMGVWRLQHEFDHLANTDMPRFDHLLHVDRDLFRAQRSVELAASSSDTMVRSGYIDEYNNQVVRTADRWVRYLVVAEGGEQEQALLAEYEPHRTVWLGSTAELVDLLRSGTAADDPAVIELLGVTGVDFSAVRSVVHDLEEVVAEAHIKSATESIETTADRTVEALLTLLVVGLVVGGVVSFNTYRAVRTQHRHSERREAEQFAEARRTAFEAELNQALDMAQTEEGAIGAVELVLMAEVPERPTELLLADSSQAHLEQAITTHRECGGPGCEVFEPSDCPSIRRGTTLLFEHSTAYSACPHMRLRDDEPFSAVCVPVSVAGRTVGVLHSTGADRAVVCAEDIHKLEQVADRAGDRIGVLRAFAQSQTQAATDPLTGLLNRRSFETQASRRLRSGRKLAFAYGDLDHFKLLNDRHGHEAGDRALRLFSKVMKDSVRDGDLVARWGGEEFVVMIDESSAGGAVGLVERIRENLVLALAGSNSAPFTASYGVSDTTMSDDLEELVALADESLLEAKRQGRDRVIVAGSWEADSSDDAHGEVTAS